MKKYTKNYLGLKKVVERQRSKPSEKCLLIRPTILTYDWDEGYIPLTRLVINRKWNGCIWNELLNRADNHSCLMGGMYARCKINKDGKYELTRHGKSILKQKKARRYENNN